MKRIIVCFTSILLVLSGNLNGVHAALRGESLPFSLSERKDDNVGSKLSRRTDTVSGAFAGVNYPGGFTTTAPTVVPSNMPSLAPTSMPSLAPSTAPSSSLSDVPSTMPSFVPSTRPSLMPSTKPSSVATIVATFSPTTTPTTIPTSTPTVSPTKPPTPPPTNLPPPPTKPPIDIALHNQIKYSHMCPPEDNDMTGDDYEQDAPTGHTPANVEFDEVEGSVDTQVDFTIVVETQEKLTTDFIFALEKEILDTVADHILSCDWYMTVDNSNRRQQQQQRQRRNNYFTDLLPSNATKSVEHNIYAVSYPTNSDASHMSTCNPTHPYSQGCFFIMLRMTINSDASAVSIAKYMALTTVKRAIKESKFIGFETVDILYMEYIGPEPVHPYWSAARSALFGEDGTRIFAIAGIATVSLLFLCCCYCCCRRCCCRPKKQYDIIQQTPDEKESFIESANGSEHAREVYRDEPLEDEP
mmetsp:Transcript_25595/g.36067  ORF Transcript_25595/g.36067 Transcript_25595/m.36067 type:complete len:470 (-) Transcript_25595:123-1532(-)